MYTFEIYLLLQPVLLYPQEISHQVGPRLKSTSGLATKQHDGFDIGPDLVLF